ncbi:6-phosphogluconate dehydrogenase [Chytridium lagenaria]|nr:6-phosphogluconate dehydrogenase [Chytridium lagenaria]
MGNALSNIDFIGNRNEKDLAASAAPRRSQGQEDHKIIVLGAGNFGTCIADHLANLGLDTTIWARDAAVVESINAHHKNSKYMSNMVLSENLKATTQLDESTINNATVIIFSIPTQHMRGILERVKSFITPSHLTIFLNKGIETSSLKLPSDIVTDVWGESLGRLATFLSGPSFAVEVVKRQPTCVSVASVVRARALRAQRLFHAPHFRVYDSADVIGVEVAGAIKNVIALASGACTGLGYQNNARAAIITRGLVFPRRNDSYRRQTWCRPLTFAGLAGVGDLMMTAQSEKSRNFTVGFRLGQGESLDHIITTLGSVAEGVETTRACYALCRKMDVDSPLCDAIYSVLYGGKRIEVAVKELMGRDPSSELRGIKDA